MIILTRKEATPEAVETALHLLNEKGFEAKRLPWKARTLLVMSRPLSAAEISELDKIGIIDTLVDPSLRAQLASREFQNDTSVVIVGNAVIGAERLTVVAGPCSVESEEQIMEVARAAKRHGANLLRGGVFKPRTSPYEFQGLGEEGLRLLAQARDETGLPVVTEILEPEKIQLLERYSDMLQIGARNMQNFSLLRTVGRSKLPVLLKRGMMATIDEWLQAAEYILLGGNQNVVLCERGIRTFEKATRNTLDLAAVPVLRKQTHLPVLVDPSHATGIRDLVTPMAKAAIAAGADGIMIEIHPKPQEALSDSHQQLDFTEFARLMEELGPFARASGRTMS